MVEDVGEDSLIVGGERIDVGGAILWAAGVRASPAAAWVGAPSDRSGRARVEADLYRPRADPTFSSSGTRRSWSSRAAA